MKALIDVYAHAFFSCPSGRRHVPAFLLAIYFFACIVIGLLLPLIPILIMQLCGMPKTEWVLIGNYLFAAGVLGGISFFLYTTYLFLREVRKKAE
ncbi:MAG: hypothetical protein Q4F94_02880 [Dialister sp.]|nr:hypothetical protein [Dialister sp.]